MKETLYPSTGETTLERVVGGGVTASNLEQLKSQAPVLDCDICTPALSRWSNVYFHAVTETLVQDAALHRAGLLPHTTYVAPVNASRVQELALDNLNARIIRTDAPIVKVPRVLITSLLYSHAVMGLDFLHFVNLTKSRFSTSSSQRRPEKIYVSRLGSPARQMLNEEELISRMQEFGFEIFLADRLTFEEQVSFFRNARFIVGAHGAGLTNVAFSPPSATLLELRPLNRQGESPMWGSSYTKISAACGLRYSAHVSKNGENQEIWEAEIPTILKTVHRCIKFLGMDG